MILCTRSGSATQSPTRSHGFSDVAGSWNTNPKRARTGRNCRWLSPAMFRPRILTSPVVGFCSAATQPTTSTSQSNNLPTGKFRSWDLRRVIKDQILRRDSVVAIRPTARPTRQLGDRVVAPRVNSDEFHAATRRLVEGQRGGRLRRPSIPTTTGATAGVGINGSSSWITATGQCAWCNRARAHRSQQAPPDRAELPAADHDHRGLLGEVNEGCRRVAGDDVTAHVDAVGCLRRVLGDLPCARKNSWPFSSYHSRSSARTTPGARGEPVPRATPA
jgi:hypothetical protein